MKSRSDSAWLMRSPRLTVFRLVAALLWIGLTPSTAPATPAAEPPPPPSGSAALLTYSLAGGFVSLEGSEKFTLVLNDLSVSDAVRFLLKGSGLHLVEETSVEIPTCGVLDSVTVPQRWRSWPDATT